jgi:hypothetical protein
VVPEREDVRAGGEQLVGELRRDPGPVGDVLGVDDTEVRAELVLEAGQPLLDSVPPRRAEDIRDEEDLQA